MTILAIVVTKEDASKAVESLEAQTVAPDRITVSDYVFPELHWQKSIVRSINRTLSEVPWRSFDYLFRMDGDFTAPPRFIESALAQGKDVVASGGPGILARTSVLEAMGGRWPEYDPEDSYFIWKAMSMGYSHETPTIRMVGRPFGKGYPLRQCVNWGVTSYKLGREPISTSRICIRAAVRAGRPQFLLALPSYLAALLLKSRRSDIADFVFRTQLDRLSRRMSM